MKRLLLSALFFFSLACVAEAGGPRHHPSVYSGYGPSVYINGGYFTPWGYQPYSMTVTPTFGGAIYQGNGGVMMPGFYSPYSYGGFVPGYGFYGGFGAF